MYTKLLWFTVIAPVLSLSDNDTRVLTGFHHPNSTCLKDFALYTLSINREKWATQMFDSMEKQPFGTLYGRYIYMGNFDECIAAKAPGFTGKHCMVDVIFGSGTLQTGNYLSYGYCVPSTCTGADIESAVRGFTPGYRNVTIQSDDKHCWTSDPVALSTADWIVIEVLCLVGILIVSSTAFDVACRTTAVTSSQYDLYSSFSLCRNFQQLIKVYDGAENFGCLHGIRSLTMFWIMLDHEYMLATQLPVINAALTFRDFVLNKYEIPIVNGFLAVDTFLLLSGLLVTVVFFRNVRKTGSYDPPAAVVHRFIRVTPTFALLVLIQSTVIGKIGRGPMWNRVVGSVVDSCREVWWTGLVYLENILSPKTRCLVPSWYLSIDMQMFWLSPVLLYPLLFWRRIGLVVLLAAVVTSLTTNFVVAYVYELGPHRIFTKSSRQLDVDYVQTHMRMTPYIVGIGLGYLLSGIRTKKIVIKLSKAWIAIGWLLSVGLCLGSMYGIIYFMDNDYGGEFARSSCYLTFHRLGWSLGVAWVIFACCAGYGGVVDRVLSWNGFQIVGKLSYSMFLVHTLIQMCRNGIVKTDSYLHDFFLVSNFFSTLSFSVLLSLVLYLFIEAPFMNLDKHFLRNLRILPYPRESGNLVVNSPKQRTTGPQLVSVIMKNW